MEGRAGSKWQGVMAERPDFQDYFLLEHAGRLPPEEQRRFVDPGAHTVRLPKVPRLSHL